MSNRGARRLARDVVRKDGLQALDWYIIRRWYRPPWPYMLVAYVLVGWAVLSPGENGQMSK